MGVAGLKVTRPILAEKSLPSLQKAGNKWKSTIQVSRSECLCGPKHAFHAAYLAMTALDQNRARAKKTEVELLLYLAGKRQIGEAIQAIGVTPETRSLAVVTVGPTESSVKNSLMDAKRILGGVEDDEVLELNPSKRRVLQKLFDINTTELKTVSRGGDWREGLLKCVLERIAMLDALKK